MTEKNYGKFCDDAVASFLSGDLTDFRETTSRLENLKVGTVRALLNQEQAKLVDTKGESFNRKFNITNMGDDDESEDGEDADMPEIVTADGLNSLAEAGTSAKDYLAGMSKSLEKDLHKEMLLEQRNLLM